MQLVEVLFTLGSLECYRLYPIDPEVPNNVFWRDAGSPQGYGPFPDAYNAMKHYEELVKAMRGGKDPETEKPFAAVIQVDFQRKQRI